MLCFFSQSDVIGILFFIFLGEELMSHIEDFDNTLRFWNAKGQKSLLHLLSSF